MPTASLPEVLGPLASMGLRMSTSGPSMAALPASGVQATVDKLISAQAFGSQSNDVVMFKREELNDVVDSLKRAVANCEALAHMSERMRKSFTLEAKGLEAAAFKLEKFLRV